MSFPWSGTLIRGLCELDGFVMRIFTRFVCRGWWCRLTNKLFECPGFRIVRQYKNDGEEGK